MKTSAKVRILVMAATLFAAFQSMYAKERALRLPTVIGDHMVLQQNSEANIFGFAEPGSKVTVSASWTHEKYSVNVPESGRWLLALPTPSGSYTPHSITIADNRGGRKKVSDVLIGEVWMSAGQSNMQHSMRGFGSVEKGNYQPVADAEAELATADIPSFRYYRVRYQLSAEPKYDVPSAEWDVCTPASAKEFQAIAFFVGRDLQKALDVPVGIIGCAYGGTRIESWMAPESFEGFAPEEFKDVSDLGGKILDKSAPSNIFNGMVTPVLDYTIRGWMWYQGESNRDNFFAYARLQKAMVAGWRARKGDREGSLPFVYAQIAPFKSSNKTSAAELREAQQDALSLIANSGMICTSDLGDYTTAHYPDKKSAGNRFYRMIMSMVYGDTSQGPWSPSFRSVKLDGGSLIVSLDHCDGLHYAEGVDNAPFCSVAGADGVLYPADVRILPDGSLSFSSESVPDPVEARYCFESWHVGSIFNAEGLPLIPFRCSIQCK